MPPAPVWAGPRNLLTVHLSDLSAQLHSVGANCTLNLFPLLAEQFAQGPCPAGLSNLFKKSLWELPLSHCPAFHTHHLSKKPKVSHSHGLLRPASSASPSADGILLSLWHSPGWHLPLQLLVCCSLCECVAWVSPILCI